MHELSRMLKSLSPVNLGIGLVFLLLSTNTYSACILKVRVNEVPPQYMSTDNGWTGRAVELMEALLKEAGCQAEYHSMPWKRALLQLEAGKIDAMMNTGYNKTRAEHFYFISPHTNETRVLLVKKDSNFRIETLEDLKKLPGPIGYETGNIFDAEFMQKYENDEVFRKKFITSPLNNLTDLVLLDRLSATLRLIENARYDLDHKPEYSKDLIMHPFRVSNLPTFFAFSKKSVNETLLLKLHSANNRVIAREGYKAILKKWE